MSRDTTNVSLKNPEKIGAGSYGCVYKGTYNNEILATKRRYVEESHPSGCLYVSEIDALARFRHDNILHAVILQAENPIDDKFTKTKIDPTGHHTQTSFRADLMYAITPFMDGDLCSFNLGKYMENESKYIINNEKLPLLKSILWQIFSGLNYIHSNGFIHRDIKPHNILYRKSDNNINIKICDFDMMVPAIHGYPYMKVFTMVYAAPEILVPMHNVALTSKVDMWATGMLILDLVNNHIDLYHNTKKYENPNDSFSLGMYMRTVHSKYFPNGKFLTEDIYKQSECNEIINFDTGNQPLNDLLSKLLNCDPECRISALDCMRHSFFSDIGLEIPRVLIVDDFIINKTYITNSMASVFEDKISDEKCDINMLSGIFLGFDILMRFMTEKYNGDGLTLGQCCYNLGVKYFERERANCIKLSNHNVNRVEAKIISRIKGIIYRDTIWNHIRKEPKKIFTYLIASSYNSDIANALFPRSFMKLKNEVKERLK